MTIRPFCTSNSRQKAAVVPGNRGQASKVATAVPVCFCLTMKARSSHLLPAFYIIKNTVNKPDQSGSTVVKTLFQTEGSGFTAAEGYCR